MGYPWGRRDRRDERGYGSPPGHLLLFPRPIIAWSACDNYSEATAHTIRSSPTENRNWKEEGITLVNAYLEPTEVEQLEKAATCFRDRLLIRLLFRLGCRISELLGLKVEDVDLTQSRVTIEHLKARMKLTCPHCGARLGKSHT